jgi:hypothetical protein
VIREINKCVTMALINTQNAQITHDVPDMPNQIMCCKGRACLQATVLHPLSNLVSLHTDPGSLYGMHCFQPALNLLLPDIIKQKNFSICYTPLQWPFNFYPPFASGCGFVLSWDLVLALTSAPLPNYRLLDPPFGIHLCGPPGWSRK